VGDVVGVAVVDSLYDLDEYLPGVLLCEISLILKAAEQLSALAQTKSYNGLLSHQEEVILVLEGFVETNTGGVIDTFQNFDLVDQ
jgi:division protein CdvB (Snf7/Vps24/ESCRT-III family)